MTAGRRCPPQPRRARARVRRRHRGRRSSRATPSTVVLLRRRRRHRGSRSTCCAGTSMAFAGGMCVFPGGGVDPRDFDADDRLGRPDAGRVGRRGSAPTRRPPGRWCARRCARRSRSPACCWPARRPDVRGRRTPPATTGRPTGRARGARAGVHRRSSTRRGLVLRTDLLRLWARWVTPVFEPRRYTHLVLRRRAAGGPAHPRRVDRVRRGGLAAGARGDRAAVDDRTRC